MARNDPAQQPPVDPSVQATNPVAPPDASPERYALYFVPENEGDHLIGLPADDLTVDEVDWYRQREPALMRDAVTPNPRTGRPLYQKTAPTGERAERIARNKQAVTNPPVVPAAPAEGGEA